MKKPFNITIASADYWKMRTLDADCVRDALLIQITQATAALVSVSNAQQAVLKLQMQHEASQARKAAHWAEMAKKYKLDPNGNYTTDDEKMTLIKVEAPAKKRRKK